MAVFGGEGEGLLTSRGNMSACFPRDRICWDSLAGLGWRGEKKEKKPCRGKRGEGENAVVLIRKKKRELLGSAVMRHEE